MVMKKSGRGSVGRAFHQIERYNSDKEFNKKRKERGRIAHQKHKDEENEYGRKWRKKLKKDINKRCKKCNKLLWCENKSGFCRKHFWIGKKKK